MLYEELIKRGYSGLLSASFLSNIREFDLQVKGIS